MNLPMFLNEVDVLTAQLSHEELEGRRVSARDAFCVKRRRCCGMRMRR